jgi:hypothetical protein
MSPDVIVNAVVMAADFGYIFLVQSAFKLFQCNKQPSGGYTLHDFPAMECYSSSWYQLLPFALMAILAYGVGIPAWFGWILYKIPQKYQEEKFRLKYSSLVVRFTPNLW